MYVGTKNMITPVSQRNWDLKASLVQATNYKSTNFRTLFEAQPSEMTAARDEVKELVMKSALHRCALLPT